MGSLDFRNWKNITFETFLRSLVEFLDCPNGGVICAEGWEEEEVCIESHRRCDGYKDCEGATMSYYLDDEINCEGKLITAKFSERHQTPNCSSKLYMRSR